MERVTVFITASKTHNSTALPDALEADGTVEVFTLLEKERSVGHSAEDHDDPSHLSREALDVANDIFCDEHCDNIDSRQKHEQMKAHSEAVADRVTSATLLKHLFLREVTVWIEPVNHQVEEQDEGEGEADKD